MKRWHLVAVLVILAAGWLQSELGRTELRGRLRQEIKAVTIERVRYMGNRARFDSTLRADSAERAFLISTNARLIQVERLNKSATADGQRADTILSRLRDSLPQLAGALDSVSAAMDSMEVWGREEHRLRREGEARIVRLDQRLAEAVTLLREADSLSTHQASTIVGLGKVALRGQSPIGLGCAAGYTLSAAGAGPGVSCGISIRIRLPSLF